MAWMQPLMRAQSRRAFIGAVGGALLAPRLTAAAHLSAQGKPVELEIWEQEISITAAKDAAAAFGKAYPNITLKWVPTPLHDTATKLLTRLAAGSGAPDVAFIDSGDVAKFTVRDGAGLVDLRDHIRASGHSTDEWVGWVLAQVVTGSGKIIGLPVDVGAQGTFYRRDVFQAAALPSDPEEVFKKIATWDDFIATGKQVVDRGYFMLSNASTVFEIIRQQGKQAYFDDSGPIVNSEQFVAAAELARRIREAKLDLRVEPYSAEWGAATKAGKIATYFEAAWLDILIRADAPETAGKWGVTVLPQGTSASSGEAYLVLPQQGQNQDAAWTFINFMVASREGLLPYLAGLRFLPGWKPIYNAPMFTSPDPFYANQVWLQQFVKAVDTVPKIDLNPNDQIAAEVVTQALNDILDNGTDIKARLDQANEEIKQRTRV